MLEFLGLFRSYHCKQNLQKMKTYLRLLIFPSFLFLALFFNSCGTAVTQMQVLQPAEMTIPDHIVVVATLDRSRPSSGFANAFESVFTGENFGQDRRGRQSAIDGLTNALTRTPRFQVRSTGFETTGSRNGNRMEAPLPWSEIRRLAEQHDADAILAIESFDSDQFLRTEEVKYKEKVDGEEVEKIKYRSDRNMQVKIGWRLYDPKERIIVDEHVALAETDVNAEGKTEELSVSNLPDQIRVTRDLGYDAGVRYGMRIAPVWITVGRNFYTSAKKEDKAEMEKAARYTKTDNWERAAEIWKAMLNSSVDPKTPGKAAHNLAVAAERMGQLQYALDWAQRAYTEYGHKSSQNYVRQLEQRINDSRKVKMQMGEN